MAYIVIVYCSPPLITHSTLNPTKVYTLQCAVFYSLWLSIIPTHCQKSLKNANYFLLSYIVIWWSYYFNLHKQPNFHSTKLFHRIVKRQILAVNFFSLKCCSSVRKGWVVSVLLQPGFNTEFNANDDAL